MSRPEELAPALLTKEEAARYLAVSPITVFRLARAGKLPHVRIGKSLRFRREDLDAFVSSKTSTTWTNPPRLEELASRMDGVIHEAARKVFAHDFGPEVEVLDGWLESGTLVMPSPSSGEPRDFLPLLRVRTSEGLFGLEFTRDRFEDFETDPAGTLRGMWTEASRKLG